MGSVRFQAEWTQVLQPAVDSLTNREIDVLELLAQRFQNKEIATQLSISPHTVNDHTRRIYDKLGVNDPRQALRRAVELGALDTRGLSSNVGSFG